VVFSSVTFLFLFFPLFLLVYYVLPFRLRSGWILAGSWVFYGWWRVDFLFLLICAAASGWFVGTRIARHRESDPRRAGLWLAAGVIVALGVLGYFKYFNFGVETLSALIETVSGRGLTAFRVILPIGISFYTFQIISYVVDVYRGDAPVARSFVDVAAYVSLFPQLVAGPIVRYREIADQLVRRSHSWEKFSQGAVRFIIGLARKVLIADAVAPIVDAVYAAPSPGLLAAWLGVAAYTIQIYFDFAAYSDMAVGMGRMLGFRFPENFDCPYHARSITEFWRRWHMTLSRWLRDYLYIPLGGNRRGGRRTIVNLMTVMALGGLWHGAAWSFLLWGVWHGAWLVAERVAGVRDRAGGWLRRTTSLLIVMVGWVLFRADSFEQAISVYAGMIGVNGPALSPAVAWQVGNGALVALLSGWVLVVAEPWLLRGVAVISPGAFAELRAIARPARNVVHGERGRATPRPLLAAAVRAALYAAFVLSLVRVLAASYSPFLYFQF
jgi:alginate O-acetyltransferase complex protein AlgI